MDVETGVARANRLAQASRLRDMGHAPMEPRHGLAIGGGVTRATGTARRDAALEMTDHHRSLDKQGGKRRITLAGGDDIWRR